MWTIWAKGGTFGLTIWIIELCQTQGRLWISIASPILMTSSVCHIKYIVPTICRNIVLTCVHLRHKLVGWHIGNEKTKQNKPNQNTKEEKECRLSVLDKTHVLQTKSTSPPPPISLWHSKYVVEISIHKVTPFSSSLFHLIPNFCTYKSRPKLELKVQKCKDELSKFLTMGGFFIYKFNKLHL